MWHVHKRRRARLNLASGSVSAIGRELGATHGVEGGRNGAGACGGGGAEGRAEGNGNGGGGGSSVGFGLGLVPESTRVWLSSGCSTTAGPKRSSSGEAAPSPQSSSPSLLTLEQTDTVLFVLLQIQSAKYETRAYTPPAPHSFFGPKLTTPTRTVSPSSSSPKSGPPESPWHASAPSPPAQSMSSEILPLPFTSKPKFQS